MATAQTRTFRMERTFDCTPEELWEAWTPDGARYPEEAIFKVVDRPRELVLYQPNDDRHDIFSGYPLTMRVRFEAVGKKTRLIFEHSGYPPTFPMDEPKRGFTACFDKLANLIEARA